MLKYSDIILPTFALLLAITTSLVEGGEKVYTEVKLAPPGPNQTCMLWQQCKTRVPGFLTPGRDMNTTPCREDGGPVQATDILNPYIEYYAPRPINKTD